MTNQLQTQKGKSEEMNLKITRTIGEDRRITFWLLLSPSPLTQGTIGFFSLNLYSLASLLHQNH